MIPYFVKQPLYSRESYSMLAGLKINLKPKISQRIAFDTFVMHKHRKMSYKKTTV